MAKIKSLKLKEDFKKMDKVLLIFTLILFVFGLFMIFSASNVSLSMSGKNPFLYFYKQAIILIISLFAFIIVLKIPSKYYFLISVFVGSLIILLLIWLLLFGDTTRGAKSWIDLGFSFQPSELAKVLLIMFFGTYYEKFKEKCSNSFFKTLIPIFIALFIFALVFLQPDLGTAIIIAIIVSLIFISSPIDRKKKIIISLVTITIALIGVILLFGFDFKSKLLSQTQLDRLNFNDPCSRYTEATGYQLCNGFIAMNNGGLLGRGFGNSTQKYLYLPEPHNDFIMAIIVEELGLVVFLLIMAVYILILYRILRIAKRAINMRNSIIAYGVAVYIFSHIVVNLGGIFGLFPMTGVPLPFLSAGGSSALTITFALALVQRINIETYDYKRKMIKEGNY